MTDYICWRRLGEGAPSVGLWGSHQPYCVKTSQGICVGVTHTPIAFHSFSVSKGHKLTAELVEFYFGLSLEPYTEGTNVV